MFVVKTSCPTVSHLSTCHNPPHLLPMTCMTELLQQTMIVDMYFRPPACKLLTTTLNFRLLFNHPSFQRLLQVSPGPHKGEPLGTAEAGFYRLDALHVAQLCQNIEWRLRNPKLRQKFPDWPKGSQWWKGVYNQWRLGKPIKVQINDNSQPQRKKHSERCKHCALAVVRRSQKFLRRLRSPSRGRRTAKI